VVATILKTLDIKPHGNYQKKKEKKSYDPGETFNVHYGFKNKLVYINLGFKKMLIIFVFLEIKIQFVNLLYEIHFNILNLGTKTKAYLEIKVMKLGTKTETKPKPIP
jgi:hypothetical protein